MKWERIVNGQIVLKKCDVCFTRSYNFFGKAIRFFTRARGESPSIVNHTFPIKNYIGYVAGRHEYSIIDIVGTVHYAKLDRYKDVPIIICRDKTLNKKEKKIIGEYLDGFVGRLYSPLKVVGQLLDGLLGKITGKNHTWFTKKLSFDWLVICSYVVAKAWAYVGRYFGIDAGVADPDDMLDYILTHTDKWEIIFVSDSMLPYLEKEQEYYRKLQVLKGSLVCSVFS